MLWKPSFESSVVTRHRICGSSSTTSTGFIIIEERSSYSQFAWCLVDDAEQAIVAEMTPYGYAHFLTGARSGDSAAALGTWCRIVTRYLRFFANRNLRSERLLDRGTFSVPGRTVEVSRQVGKP